MTEAFGWGFLGALSLVLGAVIVTVRTPRPHTLGLVMAFGAGVLISAVAYELVEKSVAIGEALWTGIGFGAGAIAFAAGDATIARLGYQHRKDVGGGSTDASGTAILLGTVLDGVPESMVIGLTLVGGAEVSASMLVAVFVSNLPESIAASSGLLASGWSRGHVLAMWMSVAIASGLAAAIGFAIGDDASAAFSAFVLAFAGGAILDMLATSMMPEAYEHSGRAAGLVTTLGFATALGISIATA